MTEAALGVKKTALTASAPADPPFSRWDVASFERFYNAHAAAIYRFIFYRTGMDRAIAAELTGDVFLAAWSQPPVGANESAATRIADQQFPAVLFGIAKRKIVDHYRTQRRAKEIRFSDLSQAEQSWLNGMLSDSAGDKAPEGEISQDARQLVGEILSALDPQTQELLVEKYIRRTSVRQLAEKLEKSEDAVTSMLARARVKFREAFRLRSKGTT
jgi:RNA polymerase sigma factor (sigma-70 family)